MKERTYPNTLDTNGLADRLETTFRSEGYQVQRLGTPDNLYVQIKKAGIGRTLIGMDQALTARMMKSGGNTMISLGQARWADKAVVGTIEFLVFWPLMATAGYGIYEQHKLPGKIWQVIDSYASSQGSTHTDEKEVIPVHCPHCGVTNSADAKFCTACGAQLS
jgi:hypothetical protein